jgi:hypothetical protein
LNYAKEGPAFSKEVKDNIPHQRHKETWNKVKQRFKDTMATSRRPSSLKFEEPTQTVFAPYQQSQGKLKHIDSCYIIYNNVSLFFQIQNYFLSKKLM